MDVRCEKCQTEYELDEARLKPGGVTVKCTNCGHMFKIRKRSATNVGAPAVEARPRTGAPSDAPTLREDDERHWLIRLENGEQKSCRELATLQQWIVACVVGRESLISRTGKTWKRLGDIAELAQYFAIADEARTQRDARRANPTSKPPHRDEPPGRGTMLGVGTPANVTGGKVLPDDDDDEVRTTGTYATPRRPATQPPPPPSKTPALGSNTAQPSMLRTPPPTDGAAPAPAPAAAVRRPATQPPPPPKPSAATAAARAATPPAGSAVPASAPSTPSAATPPAGPAVSATATTVASTSGPIAPSDGLPSLKAPPPEGNRGTALWAREGASKVGAGAPPAAAGPIGPSTGKLAAIPDEPAFAGRIRVEPPDEASFQTGRVRVEDDDDDVLPPRRGSSAGLAIALAVLLLGGAAAFAVWYLVLRTPDRAAAPTDAAVATVTADAGSAAAPPGDAAAPTAAPPGELEAARDELTNDVEDRLQAAYAALAGKDAADALAARALLGAALAQAELDRADLIDDKARAEALRKHARELVLEVATAAQKARKAQPDAVAGNLAMAHVLRLQRKSAREIARYLEVARAKPGAWSREIALADALRLARDGKLSDARAAFAAIDAGDGALEKSNDVRARYHLALIALAEDHRDDAQALVEKVLAARPEHAGARALAAKLATSVATSDPLPPEDPRPDPRPDPSTKKPPTPTPPTPPPARDDYDSLVRRADTLAQTSCARAMELYNKALEHKPNGVEALTGLGYCQLDAKNFASAQSKFRTALVISPRFKPALAGIAEAYEQQGRKDDAIAAWRRYLDAYPGDRRGTAALARLGAAAPSAPTPPSNPDGGDPPAAGSNAGSASEPAPAPASPTPPAPAPAEGGTE